jgi:hypothetical protein
MDITYLLILTAVNFTAQVRVYFIYCFLKMSFARIDTLTSVDTRAGLMHGAMLGLGHLSAAC